MAKRKAVATILFVDIMDSMEIANYWDTKKYSDFLNEFQWMILTQIEVEGKKGIKAVKVAGDELVVFYSSKDIAEDIVRAVDLANALKIRWYTCDTNLRRIREGKKIFDLGVGINTGEVMFDKRPFRKNMKTLVDRRRTFEGLAISLAKRVEGLSREGKYSRIMIGHRTMAELSKLYHSYEYQFMGLQKFKGMSQATPVFELKSCYSFQAEVLAKYRDLDWAIKQLERTVVYDPTNIWLLMTLINIYSERKLFKKVEKVCREAIAIDDSVANIHLELAYALAEQKMYEEAVICCDKAISLRPGHWSPYLIKTGCLIFLGFYDECIKVCQHLDKTGTTWLKREFGDVLYYNMGAAYARKGETNKALRSIRKAVKFGGRKTIVSLKKDKDGDFVSLADKSAFKEILARKGE